MTFRDLKLPKNLSKKKKIALYKCWILDPISKGGPLRMLNIDSGRDRFSLTEEAAFAYALNQACKSDLKEDFEKIQKSDYSPEAIADFVMMLTRKHIVIIEIVMRNGMMDENIIDLPGYKSTPEEVQYDPDMLTLTATAGSGNFARYDEMHVNNYNIRELEFEVSDATELVTLTKLVWEPSVINQSVTGG